MNKKTLIYCSLASLLTFFILCLGIGAGSSEIHFLDILSIISHKIFHTNLRPHIKPSDVIIIWTLRLPRVLLAFFVGGAISVSGAVMQSILKNPLASPYTLGVSSGASLGASIIILTGFSLPLIANFTLPLTGFIMGLLTVSGVLIFAKKVDQTLSNMTIILTGMVFSLFLNAFLTLLTSFAGESMNTLILWQMGSFSMRGWPYFQIYLPFFLVGVLGIYRYTKEMDILSFGEEEATALGVSTIRIKKQLFIFTAVLTGACVAVSGVIGFVDLVAPHIVRKIFGVKHHIVIPMCLLIGGCIMVIADLAARTLISPSELPIGAITALIGAPFFAYIYFGKGRG
jgi:iron complex transport system permease protein